MGAAKLDGRLVAPAVANYVGDVWKFRWCDGLKRLLSCGCNMLLEIEREIERDGERIYSCWKFWNRVPVQFLLLRWYSLSIVIHKRLHKSLGICIRSECFSESVEDGCLMREILKEDKGRRGDNAQD